MYLTVIITHVCYLKHCIIEINSYCNSILLYVSFTEMKLDPVGEVHHIFGHVKIFALGGSGKMSQ